MLKIYLCLHGSRLGGFGTWAECEYLQRGMLGKVWGRRALVDCIAVRLLVAGDIGSTCSCFRQPMPHLSWSYSNYDNQLDPIA